MAKKIFSSEEAFQILSMTDESSGELSSANSDPESDSAFEPTDSSGSANDSEEEWVPPKRARLSGNLDQTPSTSSANSDIPRPSTSAAASNRPREQMPRPSTSAAAGDRPREQMSRPTATSRPSTSTATSNPPTASTGATRPPRARAATYLPEALANPTWLPSNSGSARIPSFTAQPGVQVNTQEFSELDYFSLFLPDTLLQFIVDQTNLYAQQYIANNPQSSYARPFEWRDVSLEEFKRFMGLTINMGLTKKNQGHAYWSSKPIHHMPIYSALMPRSRYEMIMRFLHFSDNTQCPPRNDPNYDRLYKLRPLLNFFSQQFAELYVPEQHICVDESLVPFSGRLGIKQYIPSKKASYGVKFYKLCERATGYLYAFRIYEGRDSQLQPPECPPYLGTSGKIVWDLAYPLLNKGYHIYVDNFYTSLPLFRHLYLKATLACGTSRKNRKGFPQSLVNKKLQKGERATLRCNEVLALRWKDNRDVYMMSTIHDDTTVEVQRRQGPVVKPTCIQDYNLYMGGVDFNDQMLQPYLSIRRSRFWYKKVAIYLIHLAMYNAYVIFTKSRESPAHLLQFIEEVVTSLIYQSTPPEELRSESVSRLHERHFPRRIPPSETGRRRQKRCRVCTKKGFRKDTSYHCHQCPSQPGLCIDECFELYHTSLNY